MVVRVYNFKYEFKYSRESFVVGNDAHTHTTVIEGGDERLTLLLKASNMKMIKPLK